ncbi:MAG: LPS export ABC transporter periplasmic protein LptC [Alphaproteobacteria bacterium]|nr:LPS export ABC transporter periplasmic protein LptC [Alphaproteobacteria bacterium]
MTTDRRTFIIFTKHRRLQRLWQFFFTGWGLIMVAALVAGALFTHQLLWTPISAINMNDIVTNQFKMTNASFSGIDKDGNPFKLHAASARQEYDNQDNIFLDKVSGTITRNVDGKKETTKISARSGRYSIPNRTITLNGDVRVDSTTQDKILTDELVIKL